MKQIAENARVVKKGSNKYEVSDVDRPYIKIGKTKKNSNKVINIFKVLELQPNYLMKEFGDLLSNGV